MVVLYILISENIGTEEDNGENNNYNLVFYNMMLLEEDLFFPATFIALNASIVDFEDLKSSIFFLNSSRDHRW